MSSPEGRTAPTANRAPETVIVRAVTGRLVTRISADAAGELLAAGKADAVGRDRLRYIRLHADVELQRGPRGWWIVEDSRRLYGDATTRRGIAATEHPRLRVEKAATR